MDQAGLRHELKYEISLPTAALLQSRLRAIMRPDPHAGPYGYYIRSLYFDDLDNNAYREKLDGLRVGASCACGSITSGRTTLSLKIRKKSEISPEKRPCGCPKRWRRP